MQPELEQKPYFFRQAFRVFFFRTELRKLCRIAVAG